MATTNIQSFAGDVEVAGELTVTGQLNSTTGSDKVKLTATTASETDYIPLSKGTTGAQPLYTDSNLTYNPANNVIGANVSGNATFATSATHANNANTVAFTDRDANNTTDYIAFVDTHAAGDKALFTDQNLTYNSSTNQIGANLSGNVAGNVSGNAAYADNAGLLFGAAASTGANADSIALRNGSADIYARLFRSTYGNQSNISGAMAFRVNNGNDNYIRFCNDTGSIRTFLNVPTRTGGNASGTWSINVNGNAAFATNATFATSATHANAANAVKFTDRDNSNNTDYIAFVDSHSAGDKALFTDSNLTYNSSTNHINANVPYANSAGSATNATFATSATHANNANTVKFTDRDTNNETDYIAFVANHTAGDKALYTDSNLTYNPSSNYLNANVPYANSAGSATNASFATNATFANKAGCPAFFDASHTQGVGAGSYYNFNLHHVRIPSNMTLNSYFYAPTAGYYRLTFSGMSNYTGGASTFGWLKQGSRYGSSSNCDYVYDYHGGASHNQQSSSVIMYLGVGQHARIRRISGTASGSRNRYVGFFLSN